MYLIPVVEFDIRAEDSFCTIHDAPVGRNNLVNQLLQCAHIRVVVLYHAECHQHLFLKTTLVLRYNAERILFYLSI